MPSPVAITAAGIDSSRRPIRQASPVRHIASATGASTGLKAATSPTIRPAPIQRADRVAVEAGSSAISSISTASSVGRSDSTWAGRSASRRSSARPTVSAGAIIQAICPGATIRHNAAIAPAPTPSHSAKASRTAPQPSPKRVAAPT